jgi:hypothetical protein
MFLSAISTLFFYVSLLPLIKAGDDGPTPVTISFTDPATNITFQRFFGAKSSFAFGIALPQNPSTDFIGQISCPTPNNAGWGGIALQDDMVGPLLLAAWPDGTTVRSSFRLAKTEDASPPVAAGSFNAIQIPQGTSVNGTHMLFTFLCQNCIDSTFGFAASDTSAGNFSMGWALAATSVTSAADNATELPFHKAGRFLPLAKRMSGSADFKGFDSFNAQLSLARSANFGTWAAMAGIASNGSSTPVAAAPATATTTKGKDDDDDDDDDNDSGGEDDG